MRTRLTALLAAAAFVAFPLAAGAQVEGLAPYDGPLPGTEPDHLSITLVRDRWTGAPLAGVSIRRYLEIVDPRVVSAPFANEGRTDAFGLVSIPVKKGSPDSHWVFEKPGHAVAEEYGILCDPIVELRPGRELFGQVFDAWGRPAREVPVELFLGCGHSPGVRRVKTDVNGRFTMTDVTPYFGTLWIPAPRLAAHNVVGPAGTKNQPCVVHAAHPGVVLRGVVVDEHGRPLPDVVVRSAQETRGPAATTGPDGCFELTGYDPAESLRLCGPDKREVWIEDGSFALDRPAQLVYPPREGDDDAAPVTVDLRVQVVDADSGKPVADAILRLHEPKTGRIQRIDLGDDDPPKAPPGHCLLGVGDTWSSHFAPPLPVILDAKSTAPLQLAAHRRPMLVVDRQGFPADRKVNLELVLGRETLQLPGSDDVDADEPVFLPAEAEVVLRAEALGLVRHFPVGPAVDGKRRVTVKWPATRRIRVDFGRRYTLALRHAASRQTADGVLETHATGMVTLVVADRELGEQEIRVDLPERAGDEVRVAADALRAPGRLHLTLPDGSPPAKAHLQIDGELEQLDENGRLVSWQLKDGAAIRVRCEGRASLRHALAGAGPHELRWGGAQLEIAVAGPTGFTAYVDGDLFTATGSRLNVLGLAAGTHTVIVAARGHQGRTFRVKLGDGETRAVQLALPKRP